MVIYSWASDQLWEFLEGQNCMKKFLTAGKIQQKYSGIYNSKQFSSFSSFFKGEQKRASTDSNLVFVCILQNILWRHRMQN